MVTRYLDLARLRRFAKQHSRQWKMWRESEQFILHQLVDPEKCSVDVGANRGQYALQLVALSKHCHAFECNPLLVEDIRKLFTGLDNLTIHQIGLSDSVGVATLSIPKIKGRAADGSSTLSPGNVLSWADDVDRLTVEISTLDKFNFSNLGFIKIDVEGHELAVVEGALQTIKRERPMVLIECEERHNIGGLSRLSTTFEGLGYFAYFLKDRRLHSLSSFNVAEFQNPNSLKNKKIRSEQSYINNFIFSPRALSERLA